MAIKAYTIYIILLASGTMFLFQQARFAWKDGSSKIGRLKKVQEENKERMVKARQQARKGRKLRCRAVLLTVICMFLLIWLIVIATVMISSG